MSLFVDKSWGRKKLEQVRVATSVQQWPDWGMTCVSCSFSEALCEQRKFTPFTLTVITYILPVPFIMKMYRLPVITYLYLHVVQLPGDIGLLSSLTSLDVSHNPLTTLPDELGKCHKMWEVHCTLCLCFFFWKNLTSKCHRVDRCIQ